MTKKYIHTELLPKLTSEIKELTLYWIIAELNKKLSIATKEDIDLIFSGSIPDNPDTPDIPDTPEPEVKNIVKRILVKSKYLPSEKEGLVNIDGETYEYDGNTYYKWVRYEEGDDGLAHSDTYYEEEVWVLTDTLDIDHEFTYESDECQYVIEFMNEEENSYPIQRDTFLPVITIEENGHIKRVLRKKCPYTIKEGLVNFNDDYVMYKGEKYYVWQKFEELNGESVPDLYLRDYNILVLTTTLTPELPFTQESPEFAYRIDVRDYYKPTSLEALINLNEETIEYNGQTYYKWVKYEDFSGESRIADLLGAQVFVLTDTLDINNTISYDSPEVKYVLSIYDNEQEEVGNYYLDKDYYPPIILEENGDIKRTMIAHGRIDLCLEYGGIYAHGVYATITDDNVVTEVDQDGNVTEYTLESEENEEINNE